MSWPLQRIGDVCISTAIRDPGDDPDELFRYVDISSIDRDKKTIVNVTEFQGAAAPSRARKEIRATDVLVSTVRPNLNAIALVPPDLDNQIASTGFSVLRADRSVLNERYLFYFTQTPAFICELLERVRGAHYPAVSDNDVRNVKIPVPPLPEQRRIVEILDQADELRKKRAETDAKAARILPALFYKMFGDPVTNPMGWEKKKLTTLLSQIEGGWSPRCLDRKAAEDEWGVLKLGAVTWCSFDECENKALPPDTRPRPELEVRARDVLFTRKNTRELVAACAFVRQTRPRLMLCDLIFRLKIADEQILLPEYLAVLIGHTSQRKQIQQLAGGSAGSMPNISRGRLLNFQIPVPPIELQKSFAVGFNRLDALADVAASRYAQIELAFKTLVSRAFAAQLTASRRKAGGEPFRVNLQKQRRT